MKLKSVYVRKSGQAQLDWETDEISLEPGLNEVVVRDFESCGSLITEELTVATLTSDVIVGGFEWELDSPKSAVKDEIILSEIENLETELKQLESELLELCNREREYLERWLDGDFESDEDQSSYDPPENSPPYHREQIRSEQLRFQKHHRRRSVRDRLVALRKQDRSLGTLDEEPTVSRVIKFSCYNAKPDPLGATFRVSTLWKNVNFSLGFIMTFPTAPLEGACSVTETLEIIQNTEIDWENCRILYGLSVFTATCRRGIPSLHYWYKRNLHTRLIRTLDAYITRTCMWTIQFHAADLPFQRRMHKCKVYAAGKFIGDFMAEASLMEAEDPHKPETCFRVRDVMIDNTITIEDKSDGSQQLRFNGKKASGGKILVYGLDSSQLDPDTITVKPLQTCTLPIPGTLFGIPQYSKLNA